VNCGPMPVQTFEKNTQHLIFFFSPKKIYTERERKKSKEWAEKAK